MKISDLLSLAGRNLMFLLAGVIFCLPAEVSAQWLTDVGFTRLSNEFGSALEDGTGVISKIVEAPSGGPDLFVPDNNHALLQAKTYMIESPAGGTSSHATSVAVRFHATLGMAPGMDPTSVYNANDYIGRVLNFNTGGDPLDDFHDLGNHSYIANLSADFTDELAANILQRFDFVINRDNAIETVGINNSAGTSIPALFAPSYNAITVGRSTGAHSSGTTNLVNYGPGRTRPHIVNGTTFVSFTTPMVGSAVGLLREAGFGTNAEQNEVIRALLFAGATKGEFPDWDQTATRRIDETYGFGELNIYNSYKILQGGEFDGAIAPAGNVALFGWDYGDFDGVNEQSYDFEINSRLSELSVALVWNIDVVDTNRSPAVFAPVTTLPDLNLEILDSSGNVVEASMGTLDNFEHLHLTSLPRGNYTLTVTGDLPTDYALGWRIVSGAIEGGKLLDGVVIGGTLADANIDDDVDYSLEPSPTNNPAKQQVDIIFNSTTNEASPTVFNFRVEAAVIDALPGSADVIQTIRLFNHTTRRFEVVDVRPASIDVDSMAVATGTGDLSRFVHPVNGEVIASVIWDSDEFAGDTFEWSIDLDQAIWVIE